MSGKGASVAHMIAVLCMQMVREDPGLIVRLQELAVKQEVPFEADKLDAGVIELAEGGVTMIGQRLLRGSPSMFAFDLPIPRIERGLERSAGALAVGSFTTEYIHTSAARFAAFSKWMTAKHPSAVEGTSIVRDAIEDADTMLTLMAHVANQISDSGALEDEPEAVHDDSI